MSDDIINQVQSLIDAKKGDPARLQQILDMLKQGTPLDISDQNYLQQIIEESKPPEHSDIQYTGMPESFETPKPQDEKPVDEPGIQKTRSESKRSIIIIASVIAAIVIAYAGLDAYSVNTLEFRPHAGNQYQISPTEMHIQADVCNPSFLPVAFNKYEISAFYNSQLIEQADIQGNMISPKTMATLDGIFALNADAVMKLKQVNDTFDPSLAKITTTVDAPIFGAIPFSVVKQYSAEQFQEILKNGPPGAFSCTPT